MGLPPTPTPITKRRYDNPPSLPRSLVTPSEFMETDEPVPSVQPKIQLQTQNPTQNPTQTQTQTQTQTLKYPHPARFMTPNQSAVTPQQRVTPNIVQTVASPVPSKQVQPSQTRPPPGPKMGFFTDRFERRPTVSSLPSSRSVQQIPPTQPQHQPETVQPQSRLPPDGVSSEYVESLERERARAINLQQALQTQDRLPQMAAQSSLSHQPIGSQYGRPVHSGLPERRTEAEERSVTPGPSAPLISRQGQNMFRSMNAMGSPAQTPILLHSSSFRPGSMNSPPRREEFPSGPVSAPSPAEPATNLAPVPPPAETRKTSNVMSLLNSEPEEPRPARPRMSEQNGPSLFSRTQSPAPQNLGSSTYQPRREVFNSTPVSRSDFERPSFTQSVSHIQTPSLQHERLTGGMMTPGGSRSEWTGRPPTSQPPLSGSPHTHPPTPLAVDNRSYFPSHRTSLLSGLNPQARPSPPPNSNHPYLQRHSRTPSLSQVINSAQAPNQGMQHLQQAPQPVPQPVPQNTSSIQPSSFAQHTSSIAGMQHMQAQEQNQIRHAHNVSIGSVPTVMHQRASQAQAPSEEEYYHMQRERQYHDEQAQARQEYENRHRMDMQRENEAHFQAQQQARQQEQRHFAQYQQGHQAVHSPHSQPYPAQGMSIREQSMREAQTAMQRDAMRRDGQIYQPETREHIPMARPHYEEESRYRYANGGRDNEYSGGRPPSYARR